MLEADWIVDTQVELQFSQLHTSSPEPESDAEAASEAAAQPTTRPSISQAVSLNISSESDRYSDDEACNGEPHRSGRIKKESEALESQ